MGPLRRAVTFDASTVRKALPRSLVAPAIIFSFLAVGTGLKIGVLVLPFALAGSWASNRPLWSAFFRRLELHQGGLVYQSWRSRGSVLFDDVDEVWLDVPTQDAPSFIVHGFTLKEQNGTRHSISLLWMAPEDAIYVLTKVLATCSDELLPDAQDALAAGESLRFGPASIDAKALEVTTTSFGATKVRKMPWSEMTRVELVRGQFQFFSAEQFPIVLKMRDVPHPTLLMTLLRSLAPWQDGA